jgi:2-polyprenyl-6-methoxyphenol hydroxylase-like FAD-dependent oxidoreductase
MQHDYHVVIAGGGLAGLALSIQLKRSNPEIKILVLERRESDAATAAHKVGESTVELGSHYLREVLGLKEYLEAHELPKHGLRFFFPSHNKDHVPSRLELGPRERLPQPSHQLDRGTLENHMAKRTQELGTEFILGATVKDIAVSATGHTVMYVKDGIEYRVTCKWIADATGRGSFMKRKYQFQKPMEHHVNAVWWRLKGVIDIDDWSDNMEWRNYLKPGLRLLSTVHFMDKGYWLWVIPLGSKNTSIGIVADPAVHPFDTFNKYDKAMEWLKVNEPRGYKMLSAETDNLMDFKILKHYAHHTGRVYCAEERWGVTGEAGAFLDPLYSPGTDFIAMNNSWLSDLILRDLNGEDVSGRGGVYEQSHLALVDNWIPVYQNKYLLMGNAQIMVMKIFWDWATYWSVPTLIFTNKGFTNLKVLKELFSSASGLGRKFGALNKQMQDLFLEWLPFQQEVFENRYIDPYDLGYMREFQLGIDKQYEPDKLIEKVESNMKILEQVAASMFRLISSEVNGTPAAMKLDPYQISLKNYKGCTDLEDEQNIDPLISKDVDLMWFYSKKEVV